MRKNEKGTIHILIAVLVVVAIAAIGFFILKGKFGNKDLAGMPVPSGFDLQQAQDVPQVNNRQDLETVAASLEALDTAQLDADLNQINSDLSAF